MRCKNLADNACQKVCLMYFEGFVYVVGRWRIANGIRLNGMPASASGSSFVLNKFHILIIAFFPNCQ